MAFTQAQLDAIDEAIAQGSLRVSFSSAGTTKEVTYRSMNEMLIARDLIRRKLFKAPRRATTILVGTSKGTDRAFGREGPGEYDEGESNEWEDWPCPL